MKLLLLLIVVSCASRPPLGENQGEFVQVSTVLDQVQFSYQKGCVDAHRELRLGGAFDTCKARAKEHRLEIQSILDQDLAAE